MCPPGRARLCTNPCATGSATSTNTTGTVLLDCCSACTAGLPPHRIMSGTRAMSPAAALDVGRTPAIIDREVAADRPAELRQPLLHDRHPRLRAWVAFRHQIEPANP